MQIQWTYYVHEKFHTTLNAYHILANTQLNKTPSFSLSKIYSDTGIKKKTLFMRF